MKNQIRHNKQHILGWNFVTNISEFPELYIFFKYLLNYSDMIDNHFIQSEYE